MAGYAMGFQGGGEYEEEPSYLGGGEPLAEGEGAGMPEFSNQPVVDESAGLDLAARPDREATPTSGLLRAAEETPPVQGIRKLVSYLTGAGAANPQEAQRVVHEVKQANPGLSDDDANLLAVEQASKMGGPAAAWAMLQYNRQAYNAKQSFARTALNGIDGKAGDISAAAQAATQAGQHVLDGSSAIFTAGPEGITATVTDPETRRREQFRLTPEQFAEYLDVGKRGQWDRVMDAGIAAALKGVAGAGGAGAESAGSFAAPGAAAPMSRAKPQSNFGTTPSTLDLSGGEGEEFVPQASPYTREQEAQGSAIYPWISQEPQRQAFMASQKGATDERQNKLDIAEAGNEARERIAAIQGGSRQRVAETRTQSNERVQDRRSQSNERVADTQARAQADALKQKAILAIAKMDQQTRDGEARERGRMARAELTNPNMLLQKPEDVQRILNKYGIQNVTGAPPPAPTGQAAPPPQANRPAGIPAGAKLWNGKWYTRGQDGSAVLVPGQ